MKSLLHLNLANNNIQNVSGNFLCALPILEVLILFSNQLTEMKQDIFHSNITLREIDLHLNHISYISPSLYDKLLKVPIVRLDGNKLRLQETSFLNSTFTCRCSCQLSKSKCCLLYKAEHLHLDSNAIMRLNEGVFSSLLSLTELYLRKNQIVEVHISAFGYLPNLKILYMDENKVS